MTRRPVHVPSDGPLRAATGAYVVHSGIDKLRNLDERAKGVHGLAAGAYPFLASVDPATFTKVLGACEVGLGVALLTPIVPSTVAGVALAGFAGALCTMYLRTPEMHEPHSPWPTEQGIAVSKDVWMLGIGAALALSGTLRRRVAVAA